MKWCYVCDAGEVAMWCWLCGGVMDVGRPSWIIGRQATPGQHWIVNRPEGRLLYEIMGDLVDDTREELA